MTTCRSCGHERLEPILSLGETPLANSLLTESQLRDPEPRFPLDLALCPACSLVQIEVSVPPDQMFTEYVYFSSVADTVADNARAIAERMIVEKALGPDSLAMEVASNDGYLLQHYVKAGVPVLGVDPARNVAPAAEARGVRTLNEFFGRNLGSSLRARGCRADVLHANNVLAHVPDVNGVVAGIERVLAHDGVAVIETPYVRHLVDRLEFDTIYHEHLFYYSLTALDALLRRNGLTLVDVEVIPIHGGSLRVFAASSAEASPRPSVRRLLDEERAAGLDRIDYYRSFADRVDHLCGELRAVLGRLKGEGRRIAAYGAAAKGATLLNTIGVGTDVIDFVVDRSPHKQGRYMPGVHLAIGPPEELVEQRPDVVLLLAWNFADEVLAQQAAYRSSGGRFLVPVPEPTLI